MSEPFEMTHRRAIDILAHAGIDANEVKAPVLVATVIWNGWETNHWARGLIYDVPGKGK